MAALCSAPSLSAAGAAGRVLGAGGPGPPFEEHDAGPGSRPERGERGGPIDRVVAGHHDLSDCRQAPCGAGRAAGPVQAGCGGDDDGPVFVGGLAEQRQLEVEGQGTGDDGDPGPWRLAAGAASLLQGSGRARRPVARRSAAGTAVDEARSNPRVIHSLVLWSSTTSAT